ncbi:hypothetical protein [Methylocella sp. CPCC 101449]|uniref:hypothetical protein n=1 Tax=Methylocella sp. CPCC 101449 TaxID=2987531 RepID=UPI0028905D58|nr:hypothetical protein [Methylocella sp. CPCC 101449]MDT2022820.1 hypothetical protein [Methylocella sp. CPCC 101449]
MRVMNISSGPRGLNGVAGTVLLQPGESQDIEMTEIEERSARRTGNFHFGTGKPPASTEAELRERFAGISSQQQAQRWPIEEVKRRLQERGMLW